MGRHEVDVEDLEYLRVGGQALLARVFRPRGKGPFPAVVDGHGGAWIQGSRVNNDVINRTVAEGGVVVVSADYRIPPEASYPGSVADMNYAVRWLKANADRFGTRPDSVGLMGTSSGGHLAVLAALKPFDPRYASLPLPDGSIDAKVAFLVALWPVICPWGRFNDLKERAARGEEHYADRVGASQGQMKYWLTEEAMAEGSPTLALERGDPVELPDVLYVQALCDKLHPRSNMNQFVTNYLWRGGQAEVHLFEGEPYDLLRSRPDSKSARETFARIVRFIRNYANQ